MISFTQSYPDSDRPLAIPQATKQKSLALEIRVSVKFSLQCLQTQRVQTALVTAKLEHFSTNAVNFCSQQLVCPKASYYVSWARKTTSENIVLNLA